MYLYKIYNKPFGLYLDDIAKTTYEDYLNKDYNELIKDNLELENDHYILGKRNDIWIPKIIKYHNSLDDPLFVVGYGHLFGKYDLFKKIKNIEKVIHVEIFKNNNFVPYKI